MREKQRVKEQVNLILKMNKKIKNSIYFIKENILLHI